MAARPALPHLGCTPSGAHPRRQVAVGLSCNPCVADFSNSLLEERAYFDGPFFTMIYFPLMSQGVQYDTIMCYCFRCRETMCARPQSHMCTPLQLLLDEGSRRDRQKLRIDN